MKKVLFTLTVLLLLAAFFISGFMVFDYLKEGKEQQELNDKLAQIVSNAATAPTSKPTVPPTTADPEAPTETTVETEPTEPQILPDYQELYNMNPDIVGWIQIEGTKLNYPVMHTPDNENYYLYRNFEKWDSARGSIYAREVCDIFEPSDNITIYGHNMNDGSMFAALNAYESKQTWENNSFIFFNTLYEYHTYQIFAVYKTSANLGEGFEYHQFVDAADEAEFDKFIKTCKELSLYDTGITPKYGDKIISLSTCAYHVDNGRLVVAAVRLT